MDPSVVCPLAEDQGASLTLGDPGATTIEVGRLGAATTGDGRTTSHSKASISRVLSTKTRPLVAVCENDNLQYKSEPF